MSIEYRLSSIKVHSTWLMTDPHFARAFFAASCRSDNCHQQNVEDPHQQVMDLMMWLLTIFQCSAGRRYSDRRGAACEDVAEIWKFG